MKCPHCNKEIEEQTLKLKGIGIEIKSAVTQHGIPFSKIVIEKGWRLPSICRKKDFVNEVFAIKEKFCEELNLKSGNNDFWIEPINEGCASGFLYDGGGFHVDGDYGLSGGRSRGMLLVRDLK